MINYNSIKSNFITFFRYIRSDGKLLIYLPLCCLTLICCTLFQKEEFVLIETNYGRIAFKLYADAAPQHVQRFKELTREGFYDGVLFHRVIPGFVIQAGDPTTAEAKTKRWDYGKGGSGQTLEAEFNEHKHLRGALAMSRGAEPNSADCQWYICLQPQPHLDGYYTVFGEVIEGMAVVDSIAATDRDIYDVPNNPVRILKARIVPIDSVRQDIR